MSSVRPDLPALEFHPLTPDRWPDLETLFGKRGACGGCWCMWWKLTRAEFTRQAGEGNRTAFKSIVDAGETPGILAYADGQPAGWCAFAPREAYPTLDRSRTLKRVDDEPVWSVTCFYVAKPFRRQGLTVRLLKAIIDYVRQRGGRVIEGYPVEPGQGRMPDVFAYTGLVSAFRNAGFTEVLRRSETRPIMRFLIDDGGAWDTIASGQQAVPAGPAP